METPLYWLLLVPAIAGLVAFLWPQRSSILVRLLSLAVSIWLIYRCAGLLSSGASWGWTWLSHENIDISLDLMVTPFGAVIALLVAIFGAIISLYNLSFSDQQSCKHDAYILWSLTGAIGAALANNLIVLLISWETVTLMLFLLINLGGEKAKAGAAKTFAILGLSDCALILGIIILAVTGSGSLNKNLSMSNLNVSAETPLMVICFLLFLVAALAKAGAMPFHTWIPSAAEGAPADVMAFLPASIDKLLGIYLLARVSLEFFTIGYGLKLLLLIIGAVTIIGAAMMAMMQNDLKKLLSFCAISQMGYMVVGIGVGGVIGVAGGIFHMFNHAIYKSCLFLTAGSVEKRTGATDLDKLGGLARYMPLTFFACVVAALAISGVPPMNGFASKWMIYQACLDINNSWTSFQWIGPIVLSAVIFGSALTLASFVNVIHSVFLGAPSKETVAKPPRENSIAMTFPMLLLAIACLIFGIFAAIPLERVVGPALETLGEDAGMEALVANGQINAFNTLWKPVTATVLLIVALVFGLLIFFLGKGFKFRQDRIYLGGEKISPEKLHYGGAGFYDSIRQLPGFKGAISDAEKKVFDVYNIAGRLGGVFVEGLKRCQTGVLSLYVSWVVLGLVIIIIYLLRLGTG